MKRNRGIIFLAGVLLAGLLTLFPYGSYLDQASHQRILYSNIKEYLLHLPGDPPGLVQEFTDHGVIEISVDEDRDHGMAVYYPAFAVWYIDKTSPWAGSHFWHAYTFLLVFWGMCSLFLLGRELFQDEGLSAFIVLLFFLTPRMFAESHYNNKDVILLSLTFTLFYWGKRMMKDVSFKNICMFAFTGALASNLKIVGIWIFGALGLYILYYYIAAKRFNGQILAKAAGCILLWAALFILLTPACWPDMGSFFEYFFFSAVDYNLWHDYVLFNGKMLHRDYTGMPRKYLLVLMLYTIPIGILILSAWGCVAAAVDFIRRKGRCLEDIGYVLFMIIVGGVPLLFATLMATPLYNGWRHFYFVYASVIMGAGYGAFRLLKTAQAHGKTVLLKTGGLLYLILLAAGIAMNFPQEHSFYNLLAGRNVQERFELDYWDLSVKQAYDSVLEHAEGRAVTVSALNWPTMWGLDENQKVLPKKEQALISIVEEWKDAEYVIINTTYAYMYTREEYKWVRENYGLTASFTSYGNTICEVYHKERHGYQCEEKDQESYHIAGGRSARGAAASFSGVLHTRCSHERAYIPVTAHAGKGI
ncbi:MAG: hypothetical protein NC420_06690 [Eubacterium sp.]|nr:hypothetical protein [Eubacterium sp.]MCM1303636.1 hypothetical protein [Butyrivibrio sp.]MCM1343451.1 hypothetical protein [Muribaculaceae bacterium]MCM1411578.1 hypothetical protein [Lachnospiraceae bacterium]